MPRARGHRPAPQSPTLEGSRPSARRPFLAATNRTPVMPHALNNVALLAAGDGKFNPLDPNGAGNLIWTLLIFPGPFMWKMVFGPISAARSSSVTPRPTRRSMPPGRERAGRAQPSGGRGRPRQRQRRGEEDRRSGHARAETRERDIVENAKKEAEAMIPAPAPRSRPSATRPWHDPRRGRRPVLKAATEVLGRKVDGEDDKRLAESIINASEPASDSRPGHHSLGRGALRSRRRLMPSTRSRRTPSVLHGGRAREGLRLPVRQRRLPGRSRGDGAPDGGLHETTQKFVKLLFARRRQEVLRDIGEAFKRKVYAETGRIEASSRPRTLDDETLRSLESRRPAHREDRR